MSVMELFGRRRKLYTVSVQAMDAEMKAIHIEVSSLSLFTRFNCINFSLTGPAVNYSMPFAVLLVCVRSGTLACNLSIKPTLLSGFKWRNWYFNSYFKF